MGLPRHSLAASATDSLSVGWGKVALDWPALLNRVPFREI